MEDMDEFEDLRVLGAEPADPTAERLGAMRSSLERHIRLTTSRGERWRVARTPALLVGSVVAIAVVLGATRLNTMPGTTEASRPSRATSVGPGVSGSVLPGGATSVSVLDPDEAPLLGGHQIPLWQAEAMARFPLYRPVVGDESSLEVWTASSVSESGEAENVFAIRYGSDIAILYTPIPAGVDARERFTRQATDWDRGYVTEVAGHAAWVIPRTENLNDRSVSVVHVAMDGVEVEVQGRLPVEDLLQLVETLHV